MIVPAAESDRPSLLLGTKRRWTHKNDACGAATEGKVPVHWPMQPNGLWDFSRK